MSYTRQSGSSKLIQKLLAEACRFELANLNLNFYRAKSILPPALVRGLRIQETPNHFSPQVIVAQVPTYTSHQDRGLALGNLKGTKNVQLVFIIVWPHSRPHGLSVSLAISLLKV